MNKIINQIRKILKIEMESELLINSFQIGYQTFIVCELNHSNEVIKNQLISKLLISDLNVFWFRSYFEFETCFDLLKVDELVSFIIIG